MQRLRNRELKQAQASGRPQVWRAKQTADRGQPSANIQMAFPLPSEFRAPADQEVYSDFDESEYEEIVAKLTVTTQKSIHQKYQLQFFFLKLPCDDECHV